jgi:hypothetical protein
MNLTTPLSVQKLQKALHDKAKGSPHFRFYAPYDKIYRKDVLAFAYGCCKANGGAAAVDGQPLRTSRSTEWSGGWTNWEEPGQVTPSARRFEAGTCLYAATRRSRICRGCFNPKIQGWLQYYGRYYRSALYPYMRQLDRSLAIGRTGNTRSCAG